MIDHVNHIIQIKPQTPVTASNFQEQMEARLKPFEGCQLSSDIKAQIYLTVQQLCMEVLRSLDWVPGDMADFWNIQVQSDTAAALLEVNVVPAILKDKDVMYQTDANTPGITAVCEGVEVTAGSAIGAQIMLARSLELRQQLRDDATKPQYKHDCGCCEFLGRYHSEQDPVGDFDLYYCTKEGLPTVIARYGNAGADYVSGLSIAGQLVRNGEDQHPLAVALTRSRYNYARLGTTPAERADDKFVLAWSGMAERMYSAYGDSVDWKNFWGGPMPKWAELPRRIRAAWCFAAADASQYLKN